MLKFYGDALLSYDMSFYPISSAAQRCTAFPKVVHFFHQLARETGGRSLFADHLEKTALRVRVGSEPAARESI